MATIPSKQLHRAGSLIDLQQNLSDREIGYCPDNGVLYIKYGELVPIGLAVTSGDGIHVDTTGSQVVVSLTERNTYTAVGGQNAQGAISIVAETTGNTQNKVSVGNASNIGALVPIPTSGSKGKLLTVTENGGEMGWATLDASQVTSGTFGSERLSKNSVGIEQLDTDSMILLQGTNGIVTNVTSEAISIERSPIVGNFGKGNYSDAKYLTIGSGDKQIELNITREIVGSAITGIRITIQPSITKNTWLTGATDFTIACTGHAAKSYSYSDTTSSISDISHATVSTTPIYCILEFYDDETAPSTFNVSAKGYIYFIKSDVKYMAEFDFILKSYGSETDCVYAGSGDIRVLSDIT